MIADGMVEYHIDKRESNETWAFAPIALFSGGGVRASTEIGMSLALASLTERVYFTPIYRFGYAYVFTFRWHLLYYEKCTS